MSRPLKRTARQSLPPVKSAVIHIDGASLGNPGPAGIGVVLKVGSEPKPLELSCSLGRSTNNVAETMALIVALQEALKRGIERVTVFTDSELLSRQVSGQYRVKDDELRHLHVLIRNLQGVFAEFRIQHLPRSENRLADRLAGEGAMEGMRRSGQGRRKKPAASADRLKRDQATFWSFPEVV